MADEPVKVRRVRAGLYEVVGERCACGGVLRIDRVGSGDGTWETFCRSCQRCDCDGWRTLGVARREVRGFIRALTNKGDRGG